MTPWSAASQASLSITKTQSLLKLMSIESVMPSNHLIPCHPLLLLPSIFPSIRVFSNESVLRIRWPKYWPCVKIGYFMQCHRFDRPLLISTNNVSVISWIKFYIKHLMSWETSLNLLNNVFTVLTNNYAFWKHVMNYKSTISHLTWARFMFHLKYFQSDIHITHKINIIYFLHMFDSFKTLKLI